MRIVNLGAGALFISSKIHHLQSSKGASFGSFLILSVTEGSVKAGSHH